MNWITERIAIGNYLEAQDSELLGRHGFRSILSLDGSLTTEDAAHLNLNRLVTFQLIDGAGNDPRVIQRAVESLGDMVESHPPVFVHCHAGRSRSVIIVAGHLVQVLGIDVDEAIAQVMSKREANIAPALRELLYRL
jgi:protein-tyrosine phosphatase